MGKNYDYSYEWDIKYCYPNSFVLRNKFNITNNEELNIAEMEYTSLSIAEIKKNPIKGDFNLKHFREGNGRAQRVMIEYLAKVAGYTIDFSNYVSFEPMYDGIP